MFRFAALTLTALMVFTIVACDDPAAVDAEPDGCVGEDCVPQEDAGPMGRNCENECYLSEICEDGRCVPGPLEGMLPAPPNPVPGAPAAYARVAQEADLFQGHNASGKAGDLIIGNDRVRYIIERAGRRGAGLMPFGGNVIDAQSLERTDVEELMKVIPLINVGLTARFEEVRVLNDGSNGEAATILAVGTDTVWDAIDLNGLVGQFNLLGYDVNADLDVMIAAVYALAPGSDSLRATYTIWNQGVDTLNTPVGIAVDPRGPVHGFTPTRGYGDNEFAEILVSGGVPYFGYHGDDLMYGFVPLFSSEDNALFIPDANALLAVAGVGASVFDNISTIAAVSDSNFDVAPGTGRSFGFHLYTGSGAPAGLHASYLSKRGETSVTLSGTLEGAVDGARVAVLNAQREPLTVAEVQNGTFEVELLPGTYALQAGAEGHPLSEIVEVELGGDGGAATVTLPGTARLDFAVTRVPLDGDSTSTACRIDVIGPAGETWDWDAWRPLADVRGDSPPEGYGAVRYARHCDSTLDGSIKVPPGRYLVVVSHGPAHSVLQEVVDLAIDASVTVSGQLHEVIDTSAYVGMDCHVHSVDSPDSNISIEDRVLSYLAEDIRLIVATDHDRLTDFEPAIEAMGLAGQMGSVVGVETTPFVYGHFIGFPQEMDHSLPDRGAPDHAGGDGPSLTPPQIWTALRANGAQVVQLAHPDTYFTRWAALTFDPVAGLGVDLEVRGPNEAIRVFADEPMFGTDFDTMEISTGPSSANVGGGFRPPGSGAADDEPRMNTVLRHWFNFLSVGMQTQGVGCSDTHRLHDFPPGYSRTYVPAIPERPYGDISALEMGGTSPRHGDNLVTNGPWMSVRVGDLGPGQLLPPIDGEVTLEISVEVGAWMTPPPETLEVFVNNTYVQPADTASSRTMAPAHIGELAYETIDLANGGQVQRATYQVPLTIEQDAWVVVRLMGSGTLFPLLPASVTLDAEGDTPDTLVTEAVDGPRPFAVSNPLFIDADADGTWLAPLADGAFVAE